MAKIVERVKPVLHEMMVKRGFKRVESAYYIKERINDPSFINIIAFMYSSYPSVREISPVYGVGNIDVNRIFRQLTGRKNIWLHNQNCGYCQPMSSYKTWSLDEDVDEAGLSSVCMDIVRDIDKYSEDYFQRMSSIEALIDYYSSKPVGQMICFYLPILYLVSGQKDMGIDYLEKARKEWWFEKSSQLQEFYNNYRNYEFNRL
ncbi:MAG: hypothetical protein J6T89_01025 [Bacteroidales bacterium]|nr:hypothetical protein [Bacteroidales bacterium]